jgi:multiple sugar transport system ATP-binding protein
MADVVFRNVRKSFDGNLVLDDLDLEIADGEFVVLVGPSGCGKSTALRLLAGLEELSGGEVLIGGRVVNDLPPKDRDIAMVFQSYALYPHMSVRENMAFGLRIRKMPAAEIDRRVKEAAAVLGIAELLERKPRELSGGQRQRVALGRAIVRDPAVFLFDEPLSNLDAKLRVQMRAELSKLQKRLGTTTVYVTHDQVEAMTMGDRIAILHDGRLQQVGSPLEVYSEPANSFVATFIGTPPMNLLRGRVGAGGRVAGDGFELTLPAALAARAGAPGREVVIGLRPEHLRHPAEAGAGPTAPLAVAVEVVELLGHQAVVHGKVGGELVSAIVTPALAPPAGQGIDLAAQLDRLHLFAAETGERL